MSRAAQLMGRRGGKRSLQTMTPEERKERARKAGLASGKVRRKKAKRGLTDREIAGGLGISVERFGAALNEAGLHPHPEKVERGKARGKKANARRPEPEGA